MLETRAFRSYTLVFHSAHVLNDTDYWFTLSCFICAYWPMFQAAHIHNCMTFSLGMKFFRLNNSCYSLLNIENPTTLPIKCTGLSTPCWHEFTCYENTLERQCIVPESSPHWRTHHQPAYLLFQYHILSYVYIKIEIDYEKFGALNKFSSIQLCSPNLTRSTQ